MPVAVVRHAPLASGLVLLLVWSSFGFSFVASDSEFQWGQTTPATTCEECALSGSTLGWCTSTSSTTNGTCMVANLNDQEGNCPGIFFPAALEVQALSNSKPSMCKDIAVNVVVDSCNQFSGSQVSASQLLSALHEEVWVS
jgi:hypothetical protein